ncbi:hypothetical protein BcepSauron_327 [Burkholderia phage BcepSauron]|uniref:Uncharacterized protein n=1 Tax=Burkholderia phage BcepSauron TaxID=2530033 RepID=A0A482ML01_9CAUD|nr:hypothetical protein H1O17_gp327 [Burkholderia phage BcepSauron]QBQ74707.1 hypothetical protein BcepSauron_327 [Burkholderia phage BcepSauron]
MAEWNKHHGRPFDRSTWTPEDYTKMDAHELSLAIDYSLRAARTLGKNEAELDFDLRIDFPYEYSGYRLAAAFLTEYDNDGFGIESDEVVDALIRVLQRYEESGGAAHIGYKTGIMGNELAPAPYH